MSNKDKVWLIKDQDSIIGPFSQKEVEEQLQEGQLSPFATARKPEQNVWGFLAGHSEFARFVDKTQLTQLTSSLVTQTQDTVLKTPPSKDSPSDLSSEKHSVPYQVIKETKETTDKKPKSLSKLSTVISVFMIVSVCFSAYYFLFKQESHLKEEGSQVDEGKVWFLSGYYKQAFKIWESQVSLRKEQSTLFKILKLQLKNDLSVIASLLHETEGETRDLIQALHRLKSGDFTRAKQNLTTLIKESSSKEIKQSAVANMALLSAKDRQCDFFKDLSLKEFEYQTLFRFLFAFCLLPSSSPEERQQAKDLLQAIVNKQQSYYQEALLGRVYIQTEEGKVDPHFIQSLLDSDPYLTDHHYYPVYVDRSIYTWSQLLPLCKAIYKKKEMDPLFVSLYGYCLARARLYEQALSVIKKAERSDPESALIKSLHAYVADSIDLKNESARILGYALKFNQDQSYTLPYILQAQFCEHNQDWACAFENWRLVIRGYPHSLSGLGGMAYAKYKQGYFQEAEEYLNQGMELSEGALSEGSLYSPLLFLKQQFQNTHEDESQSLSTD